MATPVDESSLNDTDEGLLEYVRQKRARFNEILDRIGISYQSLYQQPNLVQCPYNQSHFVPEESLDKHSKLCPYLSLNLDKKTIKSFLDQLDYNYSDSPEVISVKLDSSALSAVRQYCNSADGLSHDCHVTEKEVGVQLESNEEIPTEIVQSNDPILLIRYIKSLSSIPLVYCNLIPTTFHPLSIKAWLFNNLPEHHAYKHEVGGDLHIVDAILYNLNISQTVTPNLLSDRLQCLLYSATRHFVLNIWKFLLILRIQQEHNIPDNVVLELLPLPVENKVTETSIASKIKLIADQIPPVPINCVPMNLVMLPTNEKQALYDYVVEVSKERLDDPGNILNDPSLFIDNAKMLIEQAKEKNEDKTRLEQLKEIRDVKRRRQSYRAKNVHITQKPIKQVFQEIIAARTEELREAWLLENQEEGEENATTVKTEKEEKHEMERGSKETQSHREDERYHSSERSHKRKRQRRSSSRERERGERTKDRSSPKEKKKKKHKHKSRHHSDH